MPNHEYKFPQAMLSEKRWLIRQAGKRPSSPYEKRPVDYDPPAGEEDLYKGHWRLRWSTESVLADYTTARSFLDRHEDAEGFTFVIHHFGDHKPRTRFIVLDWDKAIKGGTLDEEVRAYVELFGGYTSFSRSKRGLHTVLRVTDCPAFGNLIGQPVGKSKVDVLCSNPVAVTGEPFEGHDGEPAVIPYAELQGLPFFEYRKPGGRNTEKPEWWNEDPLDSVPDDLKVHVPQMEAAPAIEGQGGSQVLFAAACYLARHGVVGREAEVLLRCVPATPPFDDAQIQRTAECAFTRVTNDGEFGVPTPEFEVIEGAGPSQPAKEPTLDEDGVDREKVFGYDFLTAAELLSKDLNLEYLVDQAFVGEGALFIGGDQKTFKTGLAVDLLVSLTTGTPFLNYFNVNEKRTGAIFTAEIGQVKAQILLRSILHAKGNPEMGPLDVVNEVPKFGTERGGKVGGDALRRLPRFLRKRKPQVAVFDPLYLSIVGGEAADMYGMGAVIDAIVDICKTHNTLPVFCHHSKKKNQETEFQPMRLSDFYGTGPAQYARQWLLVAHAQQFAHGRAHLYATIGGSTQSREDVYEVKIDEGVTDELADRKWDVTVMATDENGPTGPVTEEAILEVLEGEPKGLTSRDLAFLLDADGQSKMIESRLRNLTKDGRVEMVNRKFKLNHEEEDFLG